MNRIDKLLDMLRPDPVSELQARFEFDALDMDELAWLANYLEVQLSEETLGLGDPYFESLLHKMAAAKGGITDGAQ